MSNINGLLFKLNKYIPFGIVRHNMNGRQIIPREFYYLGQNAENTLDQTKVVPKDYKSKGQRLFRQEYNTGTIGKDGKPATGNRYVLFDSLAHYEKWSAEQTTVQHLHEVIPEGPQKLKFDIDGEAEKITIVAPVAAPVMPIAPVEPEYYDESDELGAFLNVFAREHYNTELAEYTRLMYKYDADMDHWAIIESVSAPVMPTPPVEPEYFDERDEMSAFLNQSIRDDWVETAAAYPGQLAEYNTKLAQWNAKTPFEQITGQMFAEILHCISETFRATYSRDANFIIADSSDQTKFSRHIVISGVYVDGTHEAKAFTRLVEDVLVKKPHLHKIVDWGINKPNQNFRAPDNAKINTTRVKRIITPGVAAADMFITNIAGCERIESALLKKPDEKKVIIEATPLSAENIADAQKLAADVLGADHRFYKVKGRILNFSRVRASHCEFCNKEHTVDNTAYVVVLDGGDVLIGCGKGPGLTRKIGTIAGVAAKVDTDDEQRVRMKKSIAEERSIIDRARARMRAVRHADANIQAALDAHDAAIDKAQDAYDAAEGQIVNTLQKKLEIERTHKELGRLLATRPRLPDAVCPADWIKSNYCEKYVREFGALPRTLVVQANMGTGKSFSLRKTIAAVMKDTPQMRIIIVSFRCTYTAEVMNLLPAEFVDYRTTSKKDKMVDKYLVVQYESLNRVNVLANTPCLLVLDEPEMIADQFSHGDMRRPNWEVFEYLMEYSTHLIAMDAAPGEQTFELINDMRTGEVNMSINTFKDKNGLNDIYYGSSVKWEARLTACMRRSQAEPIVIATNSKKQADKLYKKACKLAPNAKVRLYTGDSTNEEKKDFNDVNTAFADVDILIYTSTLTAGCSFDKIRFTRVFSYFTNTKCTYNTCVQMLGRIRNVSTREYHHYFDYSDPNCNYSTKSDVERALAKGYTVCKVNANKLGLPRKINHLGEYTFPYMDSYYHAAVRNILHRSKSARQFEARFRGLRLAMGATISIIDDKPTDEQMAQMKEHRKAITAEVCAEQQAAMAAAPAVDQLEYERMKLNGCDTVEQKYSMYKTGLMIDYDVPEECITPEFIGVYYSFATRRKFRNLNTVEKQESETFDKKVDDLRAKFVPKESSMECIGDGNSLIQLMITTDLLNIVLPDPAVVDGVVRADLPRGFAATHARISEAPATRDVLEEHCNDAIVYLKQHSDLVSTAFNVRKSKILCNRSTLKHKLELINGLLRSAIGTSITSTKAGRRGDGDLYHLGEPKLFRYDEAAGKYVPRLWNPAGQPAVGRPEAPNQPVVIA